MVDALVGAIINRLWLNARIRLYMIWHDNIFIDNDIFIMHEDILNRRLRDMTIYREFYRNTRAIEIIAPTVMFPLWLCFQLHP